LSRDRVIIAISLSFLYFFTVHSVFESNGKYHIPVVWVLFILASIIVCQSREEESEYPALSSG
jgi:hypothetical protein